MSEKIKRDSAEALRSREVGCDDLEKVITDLEHQHGEIHQQNRPSVVESQARPTPDVEVDISRAVTDGHRDRFVIFLTARNHDSRSVQLVSFGIEVREIGHFVAGFGPQSFASDSSFPCTLTYGSRCQVWIGQTDLNKIIASKGDQEKVHLIGFFRDALGNEYNSAPQLFNLGDPR